MTEDIFIPHRAEKTQGKDVMSLMGRSRTFGEVGLEIECESESSVFRKENIPSPWEYHHDGSLRGNDNAEYVLSSPIEFSKVEAALETLWDMFKKDGTVLSVSNRTSVHVHLNVQLFHLNRLAAFLGMYFSIEELLAEWCGEHRVGNLFCLRAKDAMSVITTIRNFIQRDGDMRIPEGMHYAGLNCHALSKFGSIEIRTLRGVTDYKTILDWVNMLQYMYDLSKDFPDPREIPSMLSTYGPDGYLEHILGSQNKAVLLSGISFTPQRIRESLYEGIRLAQEICYSRNWNNYEPIITVFDPFGRVKNRVASSEVATGANTLEEYIAELTNMPQPVPLQTQIYSPQTAAHAASPLSFNTMTPMILSDDPDETAEIDEDYEPEYEPDFDEVDDDE